MSQHQQTMTILYSLYNKCQNVKKINSHPENLSSATNRSDKGTFSGSSEKKEQKLIFTIQRHNCDVRKESDQSNHTIFNLF